MSKIRGANTSPELKLRKALWKAGLRYRLNIRISKIRPDLIFKKQKIAIFIDGCFWHGCPTLYVAPRTRAEFWSSKLLTNTSRDRNQTKRLIEDGWIVLRYWEHELNDSINEIVNEVIQIHKEPTHAKLKTREIVTRVTLDTNSTHLESWTIEELLSRKPIRKEERLTNRKSLSK